MLEPREALVYSISGAVSIVLLVSLFLLIVGVLDTIM